MVASGSLLVHGWKAWRGINHWSSDLILTLTFVAVHTSSMVCSPILLWRHLNSWQTFTNYANLLVIRSVWNRFIRMLRLWSSNTLAIHRRLAVLMMASYWEGVVRLGRKVVHRCRADFVTHRIWSFVPRINVNIILNTIRCPKTCLCQPQCEFSKSLPLKIPSDKLVPFIYEEDSPMA